MSILKSVTVDRSESKFNSLSVKISLDDKYTGRLNDDNWRDVLDHTSQFILSTLEVGSHHTMAFFQTEAYFFNKDQPTRFFHVQFDDCINWEFLSEETSSFIAGSIVKRYKSIMDLAGKRFPEINDRATYSF
jgi:hypothetical protein